MQIMTFFCLVILVGGYSIRRFIFFKLGHVDNASLKFTISEFDLFLSGLFWVLVLIFGLFSFWLTYSYFSPLGRLFYKAKNIHSGEFKKRHDLAVRGQDFGEFFQFDLTLNKIHQELKTRKGLISKERSEFEALVGSVNQAVLSVDDQFNVRYFNAPMIALLDGEVGDLNSKVQLKLSETMRSPQILEAFNTVLTQNKIIHMVWEHQLTTSTQSRFYDVAISPLFNEKLKQVYGAVSTFHDITELKNVEKMREDFVANASHELKTPLTSILGYVGAMSSALESDDTSKVKSLFEVVQRNVGRLDKLVRDLLELSKVEGTEVVEREEVDLQILTESILFDLKSIYNKKNQTIECEYQVKVLFAHKILLERVVYNLVFNAIKYCPENAKIKIAWGTLSAGGTYLTVSDNGPGISKEHLGRLFERFYRVDKSRGSEISGTGLGLAIVKHAVQKHGGSVSVSSILGEGSVFECKFPSI